MKNSRRKEAALVASGIILGASIAAPAAGAALTAQESSQRFVVDGKSVQIESSSSVFSTLFISSHQPTLSDRRRTRRR
ncbi:MAG: hypothetical protein E7474_09845 [Ruminococcaceae bacterium]|nr:hypothetical protein [Oscillospiraceae bacterium]